MIRSYPDFLERRWNEPGMPAKIHAAADVEDIQRPIQVPWMVIAALLQEIRTAQEADRAVQERIAAGIEGLRRDVGNAGRLLGALVAGGGIGSLADLIKPSTT